MNLAIETPWTLIAKLSSSRDLQKQYHGCSQNVYLLAVDSGVLRAFSSSGRFNRHKIFLGLFPWTVLSLGWEPCRNMYTSAQCFSCLSLCLLSSYLNCFTEISTSLQQKANTSQKSSLGLPSFPSLLGRATWTSTSSASRSEHWLCNYLWMDGGRLSGASWICPIYCRSSEKLYLVLFYLKIFLLQLSLNNKQMNKENSFS